MPQFEASLTDNRDVFIKQATGSSGAIRTFHLRVMGIVFYYCAAGTQSNSVIFLYLPFILNLPRGQCYKAFLVRNLRIFVIS
jgi:hypothetical protein